MTDSKSVLKATDRLVAGLSTALQSAAQIVLAKGAIVRSTNVSVQQKAAPLMAAATTRMEAKRSELGRRLQTACSTAVKELESLSVNTKRVTVALNDFYSISDLMRSAVTEHSAELNTLASNPPGSDLLSAAINDFNESFAMLSKHAKECNPPLKQRLPFQFEYCASMDPNADSPGGGDGGGSAGIDGSAVVLSGDKILDRFGRDIWQDLCVRCGYEIQSGGKGMGMRRFHCLDCGRASVCECCHRNGWALLASTTVMERLPTSELKRFVGEKDGHIGHIFVEERNHSVFMRLSLPSDNTDDDADQHTPASSTLYKPEEHNHHYRAPTSLSVILNGALKVFGGRPLFGMKRTHPKTRLPYYDYMTYAEVRRIVIPFACALADMIGESKSIDEPTFVGLCSSNRTEWYLTDFACVLSRITSVGIQHIWSFNDIVHVMNITQLTTVVCSVEMAVKFCSTEFLSLFIPAASPLKRLIIMDICENAARMPASVVIPKGLIIVYMSELIDAKRHSHPAASNNLNTVGNCLTRSGVASIEPEDDEWGDSGKAKTVAIPGAEPVASDDNRRPNIPRNRSITTSLASVVIVELRGVAFAIAV